MSDKKWLVLLLAAVVISAALGYGLATRRASQSAHETDTSAASGKASEGERRVLYWHDPMVPGTKFDQPGKSPFMDMELVPVYADEEGGGDVRINPSVAQNLGIRIGKVEKRSLSQQLNVVGSVTFDERLVEVVQSRVEGYVTRLYVKAPLERVRRGQPLAEILAPAWLAAQEDYIALLDAPASARAIREAARQRLEVLGVPDATIRALETERKTNPTTTVFAPIDGVVTELAVREGATFMPGAPLVRINGLSTVWVNAQIPEAQASLATEDATVTASATAWPGQSFEGRVIALLPDVDVQTRTITARLAIENPRHRLAPGMFVSLSFRQSASAARLVVPSEAVIVTGERSVVIVAGENGAFEVVPVQIGVEREGFSTILSGLTEGQSIVLSGQFLIDSEASLRSTADRLTSAPDIEARP